MSAPCHCHPPSAVIMKNTFAVPTFHIYDKIHDPIFMTEIYKLLDWDSNRGIDIRVPIQVTRFAWAIISVISWILMFMFPHEALFLYLPKWLHSVNTYIIFYAIVATAALSLTYAAYKFGEGVKPGTYRLGRPAKFMDYLAFVLITAIAADGDDGQISILPIFGVVGFMWEFHCLMKLGWNFLDYTCFELMMYDTVGIFQLFIWLSVTSRAGWSSSDAYVMIVFSLVIFVFVGVMKYVLHLKNFDTIEDCRCVMCDLAMERYPKKVVELLEGSVLELVVVSQPESS